jgi:hypothetical protein
VRTLRGAIFTLRLRAAGHAELNAILRGRRQ